MQRKCWNWGLELQRQVFHMTSPCPLGTAVKVSKVSTEVRRPLIPVPLALPKAAAAQFQNPPNVISMSGAPAIPQPTLKSPKSPPVRFDSWARYNG